MPSGITSDIYEGKDVTLADYIMRVARGMTYAIMQRDSDPDAPVRHVEPSTDYHDKALAAAHALAARLATMTPADVAAAAREDYETAHASWKESKAKKEALRDRYEAMRAEVEAWDPDPLMEGTKEYALKALKESIDFDCPDDIGRFYSEPQPSSPDEWVKTQRASVARDLEYHTKARAEEIERATERNRYIDALYASLPQMVASEGKTP